MVLTVLGDDTLPDSVNRMRTLLCLMIKMHIETLPFIPGQYYDVIGSYMKEHGIAHFMSNNAQSALYILYFHIINGLCVNGTGVACLPLHEFDMATVRRHLAQIFGSRVSAGFIGLPQLSSVCLSLGRPSSTPIDLQSGADFIQSLLSADCDDMDLSMFVQNLDKMSRAALLKAAALHGMHMISANATIQSQLLHHILKGECRANIDRVLLCRSTCASLPAVVPGATDQAVLLALIYVGHFASTRVLSAVLAVLGVSPATPEKADLLYTRLHQFILKLPYGPSVLHSVSVLYAEYDKPLEMVWAHKIWPECVTAGEKALLLQQFDKAIGPSSLSMCVCASCNARVLRSETCKENENDINLDPLQPPSHILNLPSLSHQLTDHLLAFDGVSHASTGAVLTLCNACHLSLCADRMPKFALANHLFLGPVPDALNNLSVVEESMIALTRQKGIILQLKEVDSNKSSGLKAQRGFTGHTIYFPQNTQFVASVLPPSVEDIVNHICVLFVGSHPPSAEYLRLHARPLAVRPHKIRGALQWLQQNNHLYRDIQLNEATLMTIEQHGGLPFGVIHISEALIGNDATAGYFDQHGPPPEEHQLMGDIPFQSLVITDMDASPTAAQMRSAAVRHLQQGKPFLQFGHEQSPVPDHHNHLLFPSMFPTLYPYGIGGFEDPDRPIAVAFAAHLKHLLSLSDRRFQTHPSFLYTAFNILQRREVLRRTYIQVKRADFVEKAQLYARLSPDVVHCVSEKIASGDKTSQPNPDEWVVHKLMQDVQTINTSVMGSSAARTANREEIRSMIAHLGVPSFFITINPADIYNPLVQFLAGADIDINNLPLSYKADYFSQTALVADNPVVAAQFFDTYLHHFFHALLGFHKGKQKSKGLFGYTKAYYGCVEAQGRGSLHCHMVIWLEGALNPDQIREWLVHPTDKGFEQRLKAFLQSCISTNLPPDPGDILDVPSSTSHACQVRRVKPMPGESMDSFCLRRAKDMHNLVKKCQWHSHSPTCFKYCKDPLIQKCRFNIDAANVCAHTSIDHETGEITYQHLDGLINNYNDTIMEAMRCNMDIKLIGSGSSAKAILYYITDYISKSQLRLHVAYNALEIAVNKLQNNDFSSASPMALCTDEAQAFSVLRKAANSIVALQELSAQQVALFGISGKDHYTSHSFRWLFWRPIEEYVDHLLPLSLSEDSEPTPLVPATELILEDTAPTVGVSISRAKGFVQKASQLADYVYRPAELASLSLWDFTALCEKIYLSNGCKTRDPHLASESFPTDSAQSPCLPCEASMAFHRKRLYFLPEHVESSTQRVRVLRYETRAIPVLIGSSIPRRDQPDNYDRFCRLMLILFHPWRRPQDLLGNCTSWSAAFASFSQSDCFLFEHLQVINNIQLLHECKDSRDSDFRRRHAACFSTVDSLAKSATVQTSDSCCDTSMDVASSPDDHTLSALARIAAKLCSAYLTTTEPVLHTGYKASLFSLLYAPSSVINPGGGEHVATADDLRSFTSWESEYDKRKQQWKTSHALASVVQPSSSPSTSSGIASVSLFSPPVLPVSSVRDNPLSPLVSAASLLNQVAGSWCLDTDQLRAFAIVAKHACASPVDQLKMLISGPAGSGKSRIIHALCALFAARNESYRIRLTAFTGIAAKNIGGVTLHSVLHLRNTKKPSSKSLNELRQLWTGVDYLIIDEVSMIGCELLARISDALVLATGISTSFGGVNVIFAGDLSQLPPVSETRLSAQFPQHASSLSPSVQNRLRGRSLWLSVETVVLLSNNNRQTDLEDQPFRDLLSRLRVGNCNDADYALLSSRVMPLCTSRLTLNAFVDAPVIVCDNAPKDALNDRFASQFAGCM